MKKIIQVLVVTVFVFGFFAIPKLGHASDINFPAITSEINYTRPELNSVAEAKAETCQERIEKELLKECLKDSVNDHCGALADYSDWAHCFCTPSVEKDCINYRPPALPFWESYAGFRDQEFKTEDRVMGIR